MTASSHFPEPQVKQSNSAAIQVLQSFVFLGTFIGFAVAPDLSRSLARCMNAYWANYGTLKSCMTAVADRLMLLTSFITSKWRWMSPAVRPPTSVLRLLEACHTDLLMMVCNPARDPHCGSGADWISRQRAARMIRQYVGQSPWQAIQIQQFARYSKSEGSLFPRCSSPCSCNIFRTIMGVIL